MDMGLTRGNFIVLTTPPGNIWEEEEDIYLYFVLNNAARQQLLRLADEKRSPSWSSIWVHHELLSLPFMIPPSTRDEDLFKFLSDRSLEYVSFFRPRHRNLVTSSQAQTRAHVEAYFKSLFADP